MSAIEEVLRGLADAGVKFVLIGGAAAVSLGSGLTTLDVDITPSRSTANLTRLGRFLAGLDARLLVPGVSGGLAAPLDARLLGQFQNASFTTTLGQIDCCFTPDGIPGGYDQLMQQAIRTEAFGVEFCVADLDDIIRSKRAANRPKDRAALPHLEALARSRVDRG